MHGLSWICEGQESIPLTPTLLLQAPGTTHILHTFLWALPPSFIQIVTLQ